MAENIQNLFADRSKNRRTKVKLFKVLKDRKKRNGIKMIKLFQLTNYQKDKLKLLLGNLTNIQKKVLINLINDVAKGKKNKKKLKTFPMKVLHRNKINRLKLLLDNLTSAQRKLLNDLICDININKEQVEKVPLFLNQKKFNKEFQRSFSNILKVRLWDAQFMRFKKFGQGIDFQKINNGSEKAVTDLLVLNKIKNKNDNVVYPVKLFRDNLGKLFKKFDILKGEKKAMVTLEGGKRGVEKFKKIKQFNQISKILDEDLYLRKVFRVENIEDGVVKAKKLAEAERAKEEAEKVRKAKMTKAEKEAEMKKEAEAAKSAKNVKKKVRSGLRRVRWARQINASTYKARKRYYTLAEKAEEKLLYNTIVQSNLKNREKVQITSGHEYV